MVTPKPPTSVDLIWQGELVFTGTTGDLSLSIDGGAVAGPNPMQLVAFGLAGCMAIDVADIVTRGRHPMTGLSARLDGHKAAEPPSRYVKVDLHYVVTGAVPRVAVERAIRLSRDKYCSVWHSLRQDIEFNVTFDIVAAPAAA
jgi:putative redox protein